MSIEDRIARYRDAILKERAGFCPAESESSQAIEEQLCRDYGSLIVEPLLSMLEFRPDESDCLYSIIHIIDHYVLTCLGAGVLIDNADKMLASSRLLGTMLFGRICNSEDHCANLLSIALLRPEVQRRSVAALFDLVASEYPQHPDLVARARAASATLHQI